MEMLLLPAVLLPPGAPGDCAEAPGLPTSVQEAGLGDNRCCAPCAQSGEPPPWYAPVGSECGEAQLASSASLMCDPSARMWALYAKSFSCASWKAVGEVSTLGLLLSILIKTSNLKILWLLRSCFAEVGCALDGRAGGSEEGVGKEGAGGGPGALVPHSPPPSDSVVE